MEVAAGRMEKAAVSRDEDGRGKRKGGVGIGRMQCMEKAQKSVQKRRDKARVAVGKAGTSSATSNKHARPTRLAGQELAPGGDSYRRLWDFFLISFQQRFISRGFWGPATLLGARGLTHEGPAPS